MIITQQWIYIIHVSSNVVVVVVLVPFCTEPCCCKPHSFPHNAAFVRTLTNTLILMCQVVRSHKVILGVRREADWGQVSFKVLYFVFVCDIPKISTKYNCNLQVFLLKFRRFHDQFFIAIFNFCAILDVRNVALISLQCHFPDFYPP